jgi:hypothetical protein
MSMSTWWMWRPMCANASAFPRVHPGAWSANAHDDHLPAVVVVQVLAEAGSFPMGGAVLSTPQACGFVACDGWRLRWLMTDGILEAGCTHERRSEAAHA